MKHRTQRQGFSLYNLVVVSCKGHSCVLKVLKQEVAVQDEGIGLVPGLAEPRAPVLCSILVRSKVAVVAPDCVVRSDHIGTSHNLDHLHREGSAVKHIAVQLYVYTVEELDESFLIGKELVLRHLVIWLHIQPRIAGSQKQH